MIDWAVISVRTIGAAVGVMLYRTARSLNIQRYLLIHVMYCAELGHRVNSPQKGCPFYLQRADVHVRAEALSNLLLPKEKGVVTT